jgi:hypothetical protein
MKRIKLLKFTFALLFALIVNSVFADDCLVSNQNYFTEADNDNVTGTGNVIVLTVSSMCF